MAESIVSFLLDKLSTLLSDEYTQLKGLRREVQYIRDELGSMRAFLRNAEAKLDADVLDDEQKEWFKQVMEMAYDTEDVVDDFLLRFAHRRAIGFHGHFRHIYTSVKNLGARHQISSKIIDIKYRVEQISARHQRYKTSNEGVTEIGTSPHPIRGHALLLEEAGLVGIDRPKCEIISLIHTDDYESHLKAISVVGMGGLGKTTLVKRVFEAPDVKRAFSLHAWLTISETFIIGDALKKLIHQLCIDVKQPIPSEVDYMDEDGLRAFVREFLKDRRYVIVLDDLWKLDHWDSIKHVFPDDICASCIIITTRIKDIATTCCHEFRGIVHTMQSLSIDESWKLFCKKTFVEGSCPSHLVDISRSIMSKCEGLPLGIVAIGGLLALKDTNKPGEWEMVLRSFGGELEGSGKLDRVRKILLLSYNDLPYYLKSCLLYIGIFPEDAIVYTKELACLWIAEGFVEVRLGMTTMEVAQSYLNELISRSLVQVVDTKLDGRVSSCRVHHLVYKLILTKCKEYNILTTSSTPYIMLPENVRRLVIDESTFLKKNVRLLHLRSLISNHKSLSCLSNSSLSKLLEGTSKLLKVLHLEGSNINMIPEQVFKLSNLTYLNLVNTNVINIPKSIRKLQNLKYLLLEGTKVKNLPADIIMLKKLCYIGVHGILPYSLEDVSVLGFKAPYGLGELVSLQNLFYIDADSEKIIREIGKLTQLRNLCLTKITKANGRELCSSLEKLTNLEQLYIQTITRNEILDLEYSLFSTLQLLHNVVLVGRLLKIPDWIPSCRALSALSLAYSYLKEDSLGSLECLPNLVALKLYKAYTGDKLKFKSEGFQKLKYLELFDLSGLKSVELEKGTLPGLETLRIFSCTLLEELPQDIQYLSKLRALYLCDMSKRLENNLRSLDKESKEYRKFTHITEIIIGSYINGKWKMDYL